MAKIPETFNFGDRSNITTEILLEYLERMYMDLSEAINSKPDLVVRDTDGVVTETFLSQGTLNINASTNKVEMLTNHVSPVLVTWTTLS